MLPRPPRSTLFPYTRSSDLLVSQLVSESLVLALMGGIVALVLAAWGATALHGAQGRRSEEHTSELQSRQYLVCRLLLEKKKNHVSRIAEHAAVSDTTRGHLV